ncbi:MAG: hypothetical protein L0Y35_07385, partial [Flammeovirgaceae bacterium]|nr:hypothetical protein [Flammeovirgaceae bacterium]
KPGRNFGRDRRKQFVRPKSDRNPIEVQREREAREAAKRQKEEEERKKQARTQNYLKKVKTVKPAKAVTKVDEPVIVEATAQTEAPKTVLGKIKHWLFSS